ncbi:MAG: hypothetical protein M3Q15_03765 [Pseudomonadota bacterium]|nr:hypothetical protein [Pseudomonadota bacterium]
MTTFRSEAALVGLIAAGLVPWIGWTLVRGLRQGRLPIGRGYVRRDERSGAFRFLFALWVAMAALAFVIALDLLFGMNAGDWL